MPRSTVLLFAAAATLAAAGTAPARQPAAPPSAPKPAKVLIDLMPGDVDARLILPPPPAEGSPRAQAELAELHRIAAAVSPERMAQAKWDDDHEDATLLQPTLGPRFDLKTLPATAALLKLVQTDAAVAASGAKVVFNRRRPWAVDPTIKTCDPDDKPLSSYPSGHATLGYALTLTMARLLPERAQALLARGPDYAYSREICGSHFASDTQASQALAVAIVTRLAANADFQSRMSAARTELATAGIGAPR